MVGRDSDTGPSHFVDLETGAIVSAELYKADESDTTTLRPSLEAARENERAVCDEAKSSERDDDDDDGPAAGSAEDGRETIEVVTDKGYQNKVELLLELRRARYWTYIPVPEQREPEFRRQGRDACARGVPRQPKARLAEERKEPAEATRRVDRTYLRTRVRDGRAQRRLRLRGRDNARKRYIAHAAALNLGLVMRTLFGFGTPKEMAAAIAAAIKLLLRFALASFASFDRLLFGPALPADHGRYRRVARRGDRRVSWRAVSSTGC
jgi:transposase